MFCIIIIMALEHFWNNFNIKLFTYVVLETKMLKNMVAIDSEFFEIIFNTSKAEKHKKNFPYILMRSNFN